MNFRCHYLIIQHNLPIAACLTEADAFKIRNVLVDEDGGDYIEGFRIYDTTTDEFVYSPKTREGKEYMAELENFCCES